MKRNVLLAILAVLAVCICAVLFFSFQEEDCFAQTSAKPVIYLYPREETNVDVTLDYDGRLTCTYPKYTGGWSVTARPDGTLTDGAGQSYNYLYWEGEDRNEYDFSRGFCVAGADSAAFLAGFFGAAFFAAGAFVPSAATGTFVGCVCTGAASEHTFASKRTSPAFSITSNVEPIRPFTALSSPVSSGKRSA